MKRKICLINEVDACAHKIKTHSNICGDLINIDKMYTKTSWYKYIQNAEKTSMVQGNIQKVHYKFEDGKEMVEEYNIDTACMLRRAWKNKSNLGGEGTWNVEIGDPIPVADIVVDDEGIKESSDQPILTRRNTRVNLEWRVRNLPYPIETYSISANNDEKFIIVRTTNKKYFKKLPVPELERLNIPLQQANIQSSHKFNTLIIVYKKPNELLEMEKEWQQEIKKIKPVKEMPGDCNPS